jgi:hypothetical protein
MVSAIKNISSVFLRDLRGRKRGKFTTEVAEEHGGVFVEKVFASLRRDRDQFLGDGLELRGADHAMLLGVANQHRQVA